MKFKINKDVLLENLNNVGRALSNRNIIPVINGILFELNENPVCEVASQGQKRSFVLALKLGLAQIIYEKSGQYPILLLDDVFSELDNLRKRQLIEKLPNDMQIFITTTERLNMHWNREVRFYDIEQGRIKEVYK